MSRTRATPEAAATPEDLAPVAVGGVWPVNEPYERGVALLVRGPRAALPLLEAALELQPERPRIHANLALALLGLHRHEEARARAERAHELAPDDPYVTSIRLRLLSDADADTIIDAARHAMQLPDLRPADRLHAHAALCWALMRSGSTRAVAAVEETEKLVADWPDEADALAARGCALAAVCRWDEALVWLDKAIAAAPMDERLVQRRVVIVTARDQALGLLGELRDAVERHPDDADRWRELGLMLARFARLDEAMAAFGTAHQLEPVNARTKKKPLVRAALMVEATARTSLLLGMNEPIG